MPKEILGNTRLRDRLAKLVERALEAHGEANDYYQREMEQKIDELLLEVTRLDAFEVE